VGNKEFVYVRRVLMPTSSGSIDRVPKIGGGAAPIAAFTDWTFLGRGLSVVGDDVYFPASSNTSGGVHNVFVQRSGLTQLDPLVTVTTTCGVGQGCLGIQSDGNGLLWHTAIEVGWCTNPGCAGTPFTVSAPEARGAAFDAANVVFTRNTGPEGVKRCARGMACPTPTDLVGAGKTIQPDLLTIAGGTVYWIDNDTGNPDKARILACPVAGCAGDPKVIVKGEFQMGGFAVDAAGVYFTYTGIQTAPGDGYLKVCRDLVNGCGVASETLATVQQQPTSVAVDDKFAYWITLGVDGGLGAVHRVGK
jgi:hypothetical protein